MDSREVTLPGHAGSSSVTYTRTGLACEREVLTEVVKGRKVHRVACSRCGSGKLVKVARKDLQARLAAESLCSKAPTVTLKGDGWTATMVKRTRQGPTPWDANEFNVLRWTDVNITVHGFSTTMPGLGLHGYIVDGDTIKRVIPLLHSEYDLVNWCRGAAWALGSFSRESLRLLEPRRKAPKPQPEPPPEAVESRKVLEFKPRHGGPNG